MDTQELVAQIVNGNYSDEDLSLLNRVVVQQIKTNRDKRARLAMFSIRVGQKGITKGLTPARANGKTVIVTAVKQKRIEVQEEGGAGWNRYTIPATCFELLPA